MIRMNLKIWRNLGASALLVAPESPLSQLFDFTVKILSGSSSLQRKGELLFLNKIGYNSRSWFLDNQSWHKHLTKSARVLKSIIVH